MAVTSYLQMSHELEICKNHGFNKQFLSQMRRGKMHFVKTSLSSLVLRSEAWITHFPGNVHSQKCCPCKQNMFRCHSFLNPGKGIEISGMKNAAVAFTRSFNAFQDSPIVLKLVSAVGIIAFSVWGLGPLMRQSRNIFLNKNDSNWKKSTTYYVTTSYLLPMLLWTGVTLICRVVDPVALPSESSQIVKQRILNFIRSLSTVLALAYCLLSAIQQAQKFFMGTSDSTDPRHMGFQFIFKAVYTAVWVAAVSLFMELLGFSTQKWITAGGLGTLLLTLAGREIFTNFLSSAMIHATRPFILNEWIQTKIEGYDVSGTVERVGWWSPTIIRGEDREAIHIPNHQFTVNVVRNLSHKTHWRIKTHLAISHLDVNKINNIVADMRKVLAKNPQVEPKKLHRRVFLENINPENQALMILVSCFVKTSHLEEYLCVKEAILLDLLRVISHHRARLATPIRTVQKIYSDSGFENIPFSDSAFTHGGATFNRPLLLVEPSSKITRPTRTSGEQDSKAATQPAPDGKTDAKVPPQTKAKEKPTFDSKVKEGLRSDTKIDAKALEMQNLDTKEENTDHNVVDKVKAKSKQDSDVQRILPLKQESEKLPPPPVSRPPLEENIVLGVALEGSKRTLPIEEGPTQAEVKELAKSRSGNGSSAAEKDKRNSQPPNASSTTASNDQRDQQN